VLVALEKAPTSALVIDAPQESHEDDQGLDPEELVSRIREHARQDQPAQQLLALYVRGIISRRDVLKNGMTAWTYRAARERLAAYAATAAYGAATSATSDPDAAPDVATLPILRAIGVTSRPPTDPRRRFAHDSGSKNITPGRSARYLAAVAVAGGGATRRWNSSPGPTPRECAHVQRCAYARAQAAWPTLGVPSKRGTASSQSVTPALIRTYPS
jgi:hypothetical protein